MRVSRNHRFAYLYLVDLDHLTYYNANLTLIYVYGGQIINPTHHTKHKQNNDKDKDQDDDTCPANAKILAGEAVKQPLSAESWQRRLIK